jgi:SAM-dependent methyltransferase
VSEFSATYISIPRSSQGGGASALPDQWPSLWGAPSPFFRRQLRELERALTELADGIALTDDPVLAPLVSPAENVTVPVHRWYSYKEAFSHRLPREIVTRLGSGQTGVVADVFGGVATTALGLQRDPRVRRVVSVEYSPFAHLVGVAKLRWAELDPKRLRLRLARLVNYRMEDSLEVPSLAAFHNHEIFDVRTRTSLLSAHHAIARMRVSDEERNFFLVGLAAVIEDVSGAMKDGRALRILRDRRRDVCNALRPHTGRVAGSDPVRTALENQLAAMIEDLEHLAPVRVEAHHSRAEHIRGDARELDGIETDACGPTFEPESIGLFLYSPPYPNAIDYSEIYKLELWLLKLVRSANDFRTLRLGTFRSHPSVEFPERGYLDPIGATLIAETIEAVSSFVERNHPRSETGRMIRNYFDDMYRALQQQFAALEPGGHVVCVVANSTFSHREKSGPEVEEYWRLPLLTDVLIARLGEAVGFVDPELWKARDLQPRNVREGAARESLVVLRKAA